ncbi:MAG: hypothetical protein DRO39_09605, partial [Thermoprotei archaeon]
MVKVRDLVLAAVLAGADTVDEIAEALRMDRDAAEKLVRSLMAEGLLVEEERGFWIFRRRVLRLTEKGVEVAQRALEELKRVAEDVRRRVVEARGEELADVLQPYAALLPFMAYLGLLDAALLSLPLVLGFEALG